MRSYLPQPSPPTPYTHIVMESPLGQKFLSILFTVVKCLEEECVIHDKYSINPMVLNE